MNHCCYSNQFDCSITSLVCQIIFSFSSHAILNSDAKQKKIIDFFFRKLLIKLHILKEFCKEEKIFFLCSRKRTHFKYKKIDCLHPKDVKGNGIVP